MFIELVELLVRYIGYAFSFVERNEFKFFNKIREITKSKIKKQNLPSYNEMDGIKNNQILKEIRNIVKNGDLTNDINVIKSFTNKNLSTLDVAAALLKICKEK